MSENCAKIVYATMPRCVERPGLGACTEFTVHQISADPVFGISF
jgi:hypothetical protein